MKELIPFRSLTPFFRSPFGEDKESLWRQFWGTEEEASRWMPRVDIVDKPEAYLVKAEVPGLKAEEIHVNLTGDTLTLSGEKKEEQKKESDHYKLFERHYGAFERTFTFPTPVDAEHVEAEVADGVLSVRVMKREEGKAAKIKVVAN